MGYGDCYGEDWSTTFVCIAGANKMKSLWCAIGPYIRHNADAGPQLLVTLTQDVDLCAGVSKRRFGLFIFYVGIDQVYE